MLYQMIQKKHKKWWRMKIEGKVLEQVALELKRRIIDAPFPLLKCLFLGVT